MKIRLESYLDPGSHMLSKVPARESECALICLASRLDPGMTQGLRCCEPLLRISRQQLFYQIGGTAGQSKR